MDIIDRKLLDLVQLNGRGAYARYGAKVGLSAAAVHERLKKLQKSGALVGWSAVVSPLLTDNAALAFVRVQVDLPAAAQALGEAMADQPDVLECHHMSGEWSCLLKVRAPTDQALSTFIADIIAPQPGIVRLQTERVTVSAKDSHVIAVAKDTAASELG